MFFLQLDSATENVDDGYDVEPMHTNNHNSGGRYRDINEGLELNVIDNPYYGGELEPIDQSSIRFGQNITSNDVEVVTARSNIYYEM